MPRGTSSKSTLTKARVIFPDNSPSKTTPGTNNSSNTVTTPSTSNMETAEDIRLTVTINRIFSKKILAILTGKDAILKEISDYVIRNEEERLKDISPYIYTYWRDMSVKYGSLCIDERIAIPKAIKDDLLEDIPFTHTGSFAMLWLAQNIW